MEGETDKGGTYIVVEAQGGRGNVGAINGAAELARRTVYVAVPA